MFDKWIFLSDYSGPWLWFKVICRIAKSKLVATMCLSVVLFRFASTWKMRLYKRRALWRKSFVFVWKMRASNSIRVDVGFFGPLRQIEFPKTFLAVGKRFSMQIGVINIQPIKLRFLWTVAVPRKHLIAIGE